MKRILFILTLMLGCEDNKDNGFDNALPDIELDKITIVATGGGFGLPPAYSLSFSGNIINSTDNVFKSFRQNILFTAANGNQLTGEISLPMFRWLCPFDTLYGGGKSGNFEEGYIDSVVSFKSIEDGLLVIYGEGDECDGN